MTQDFPQFVPSQRQFTPGQYPTKRFTAINGVSSIRLYGNLAFDARLELQFNLSDEDVGQFISCYHQAKGAFDDLKLSTDIYAGMSDELQGQIKTHYQWRFNSAPTVESVLPGRSRINVSLIGTINT